MRLTPNLAFGGQCEAAFKFYERCFGGTIVTMLTYGKSPMAEQVPPSWREKILHATLTVGDNVLMGADPVPEQYEQPKGFAVLLGIDDPVDAERIFHALAENGAVQMPLQKPSGPSVRPLWRGCRSIRHTLGDQLRASAQRSVERKGSRKTPPDSPGNPQHLRITQLPGVVVKLDAAMRTLHSRVIGWPQLAA